MLKSSVSHSLNIEPFQKGVEVINNTLINITSPKIGFLYTSSNDNIEEIIKGIKSVQNIPLIGCTSSNGIITQDGVIENSDGFAGLMLLEDENLTVGIAALEGGKNPRNIGRKVAIQAVENAKTTRAPSYVYITTTPNNEEEYLLGIQDVIGRVPIFGGSAAANDLDDKYKIICNDKVLKDGVAVAFFYTDNEIATSFTGGYKETENYGVITEVIDNNILSKINNESALKVYAKWIGEAPKDLHKEKVMDISITKPLGIKSALGNITLIKHPIFGIDENTKTVNDDKIKLGSKIVEKTAIILLEATKEELLQINQKNIKALKQKMYTDPAAYLLMHCGRRKRLLKDNLEELYKQIVKETKQTPFIMIFTNGEYGYEEHSANMCGDLMLSFTAIGKE